MSQIYPDYAYNNPIQRGEIFLSTYIGEGYLEKLRPVVVIQNNLGNKHSRSIIVAAITSKPKKELPVNVVIDPNKYDLEVDNCTIMANQVFTIDKDYLRFKKGCLDVEDLRRLDEALIASLDLKNQEGKEMNELTVVNRNGRFVVDSRDVAEMVGKEHYNLLRDIQGYEHILLNSNLSSVDFFIKSTYQDSTGRTLPCYLITRKGCDMVANKMTGEKGVLFTAAYVTKFEEMEKALMPKYQLPKTFAEALRLAADLEEEKQKLLPKAESFDSLMSADGLYAIADAAKILNYEAIGPKKIFEVLQAEGFLFKRGRWHAKQCYIDWGYFTEKTHPLNFGSANSEVYTQVFVTPKGLDMLDKHFARNGFKKNPKVVNQ
jgi:anti-repressor protein